MAVKAKFPTALPFMPEKPTLPAMRKAVDECRGCDLYKDATQAVFGEGPARARLLFIGEQPGNDEDLAGHPFVGPAGKVLDRALADAGIPREETYVTNAVKHFKFRLQGKRRLHEKPRAAEVSACRPWLQGEITAIRPEVVVCLGATAAQSVLGPGFQLMKQHGTMLASPLAERTLATIHPSAVLRAVEPGDRESMYALLVDDLKTAWKASRAAEKN